MARALWKGAISFGLIYVPVEIQTASKDNTLPLHTLDSRDFAPVGYNRVNKNTGKEVDWSHIVKGYEYKKGDFVALAEADFKHANVKASETIEIDTFCDVSQIPAMYYEKPYYLAPTKGGDKVYSLLRQALEATDKVAVATFVMHQRQHLCAIVPQGKSLMLLTLRFADEVLPATEHTATAKISSAELAIAKQLVQSMEGKFDVTKFKDTYRADLKKRVQEKIRNKEKHSLDVKEPEKETRPKSAGHRPDGRAQGEFEQIGWRRGVQERAQSFEEEKTCLRQTRVSPADRLRGTEGVGPFPCLTFGGRRALRILG